MTEYLQAFFNGLLAEPATLGFVAVWLVGGWLVARLLRVLARHLLDRTALDVRLAKLLRQADVALFSAQLTRFVYILVLLIAVVGALRTLYSIPSVELLARDAADLFLYISSLTLVIFAFNLLLVVIASLVLLRLIGWINLGTGKLQKSVASLKGGLIRDIKIQQLEVFTADRLVGVVRLAIGYLRVLVILLTILFYLGVVFGIFPQTRGLVTNILSNALIALQRNWLAFVAYIPNLVNLLVVVFITFYALRFLNFIFREIEKGTISFSGFYPEWAAPTNQLVRVVVLALAVVVSFPFLPGSGSPAFQGVSVFLGLLLSLGSTSIVANIVSGIVLTYTRAFRVGDRVKIADTIGDVVEKTLLVTRVRTIKNVDITIPNGMVLGSHIINYSSKAKETGVILHTTITLGYDVSWRLVHATLISAAQATERIMAEPKPFVLQTSLDDFYVSYELNAYTDMPEKMALIYSDLHQTIQDKCNEAGIEILSPHYAAVRDGHHSTIPSDYLPSDYEPPAFRVDKKDIGE